MVEVQLAEMYYWVDEWEVCIILSEIKPAFKNHPRVIFLETYFARLQQPSPKPAL